MLKKQKTNNKIIQFEVEPIYLSYIFGKGWWSIQTAIDKQSNIQKKNLKNHLKYELKSHNKVFILIPVKNFIAFNKPLFLFCKFRVFVILDIGFGFNGKENIAFLNDSSCSFILC